MFIVGSGVKYSVLSARVVVCVVVAVAASEAVWSYQSEVESCLLLFTRPGRVNTVTGGTVALHW